MQGKLCVFSIYTSLRKICYHECHINHLNFDILCPFPNFCIFFCSKTTKNYITKKKIYIICIYTLYFLKNKSLIFCSKKDPALLSKTVGCLSYMLSDENTTVSKRVMLACNSLYKLALQVRKYVLPICIMCLMNMVTCI